MKLGKSSLNDIAKIHPDSLKRKRFSSYDRSGGNHDWIDVKPGEIVVLGEEEAAGSIKHIWCTMSCKSKHYLRNIIIRMYWDGESEKKPSVEVPIGDFFGVGHAKKEEFVSLPLQMTPRAAKGFNCWWPMPFSSKFKITLENDNPNLLKFYYYIDYEIYEDGFENEKSYGRFHAQWRRENPTKPKLVDIKTGEKFTKRKPIRFNYVGGKNTEPLEENYRILEAKGKGHYVGCHLDIDNITLFPFINWPGEGDDMIFIDDDISKKKPTLYGTGTEDYVNQAYGPGKKYSAPYFGTIKPGGFNFWGNITYYRFHIEDPIYFNKEIVVTIEHGHDNHRSDDWSSTAYWYQIEPHDHNLFHQLLDRHGRKPRSHFAHIIRKSLCLILLFALISLPIYWLIIQII
ncbi:MAG: glycoside hydrolase family 172 protein [Candidatus Hodarchaeota archaeon]